MVNALEDYHTCTVCDTPVHDYGPGANAVNIDGDWYHATCIEDKADILKAFNEDIQDFESALRAIDRAKGRD